MSVLHSDLMLTGGVQFSGSGSVPVAVCSHRILHHQSQLWPAPETGPPCELSATLFQTVLDEGVAGSAACM